MPRASSTSTSSAAREMNNLEEREEFKKEKASVTSENLKKKMHPTVIENLEYPK